MKWLRLCSGILLMCTTLWSTTEPVKACDFSHFCSGERSYCDEYCGNCGGVHDFTCDPFECTAECWCNSLCVVG